MASNFQMMLTFQFTTVTVNFFRKLCTSAILKINAFRQTLNVTTYKFPGLRINLNIFLSFCFPNPTKLIAKIVVNLIIFENIFFVAQSLNTTVIILFKQTKLAKFKVDDYLRKKLVNRL